MQIAIALLAFGPMTTGKPGGAETELREPVPCGPQGLCQGMAHAMPLPGPRGVSDLEASSTDGTNTHKHMH